jgi:hypothetical protein
MLHLSTKDEALLKLCEMLDDAGSPWYLFDKVALYMEKHFGSTFLPFKKRLTTEIHCCIELLRVFLFLSQRTFMCISRQMRAREKMSTINDQVIKSWFNDGTLKKWQRIFFWTQFCSVTLAIWLTS